MYRRNLVLAAAFAVSVVSPKAYGQNVTYWDVFSGKWLPKVVAGLVASETEESSDDDGVKSAKKAKTKTVKKEETPDRDLNLEEAKSLIDNFKIRMIPNKTGAEVKIYGAIPSDCHGEGITVRALKQSRKGRYGYQIHAKGAAIDCLKKFQKDPSGKWKNGSIKLSQSGVNFSISDAEVQKNGGVAKIGLVTDLSLEPDFDDEERYEWFLDPSIADYESLATRRARAEQRRLAEKKKEIARLHHEVKHCRRNGEELTLAKRALEELAHLGEIDQKRYERFLKEISLSELKSLTRRIRKTPAEELAAVEEEILGWASEYGDDITVQTRVAAVMKDIAAKHAKAGDFVAAEDTLTNAQDSLQLNDAAVSRIEGYKTQLDVSKLRTLAMRGMQGNFAFLPAYHETMMNIQNKIQHVCNQGYTGGYLSIGFGGIDADWFSPGSYDPQACMQTMAAAQQLGQLPQMAQMVDMRRYQMQMQLTAALNPGMHQQRPGMLPGMMGQPGMPGMHPGAYPGAYPHSPFANGFGAQPYGIPGSYQPGFSPYMMGGTPFLGSQAGGALPFAI